MHPSRLPLLAVVLLAPICLIATSWLYLYPLLHGCGFPMPRPSSSASSSANPHDNLAPFRLLALGDPQLEGDTSLIAPDFGSIRSIKSVWNDVRYSGSWARGKVIFTLEIAELLRGWRRETGRWLSRARKQVDLWGNDWYLGHVVSRLRWATRPSHVAVLGDLLGSQWVGEEEFGRRGERFWGRVARGLGKVEGAVMGEWEEEGGNEAPGGNEWGGTTQVLGEDKSWETRVINIAGNHDIGYAGDLDESRVERFEKTFGKVNWDIWFTLPRRSSSGNTTTTNNHTDTDNNDTEEGAKEDDSDIPTLRLIILNSMNLDTPALSPSLQSSTYTFLNHLITTSLPVTSRTHATILLTHIPLHKPAGICVDSPFFDFFDAGQDPAYAGGVKEQNMLSEYASKSILEGIFGLSGDERAEGQGRGRYGVVVNGHDHEGCDVLHHYPRDGDTCSSAPESSSDDADKNENEQTQQPSYRTLRLPTSPSRPESPLVPFNDKPCLPQPVTPQLREITLRSMMGSFGGYAGFLSAWFEEDVGEKGEWRIEFNTCGFAVQHWWWAVNILNLIWGISAVACLGVWSWQRAVKKDGGMRVGEKGKREKEKKENDARMRGRKPEAVNDNEKPKDTETSPSPPPAQENAGHLHFREPQALEKSDLRVSPSSPAPTNPPITLTTASSR